MRILGGGLVQVRFAFNILNSAYCGHIIAGRIVCRFEGELPESQNNMRALGDHLRCQQSSGYQPFFTVKDDIDGPDRKQVSGRNFRVLLR